MFECGMGRIVRACAYPFWGLMMLRFDSYLTRLVHIALSVRISIRKRTNLIFISYSKSILTIYLDTISSQSESSPNEERGRVPDCYARERP
jgi:hypothetical protein